MSHLSLSEHTNPHMTEQQQMAYDTPNRFIAYDPHLMPAQHGGVLVQHHPSLFHPYRFCGSRDSLFSEQYHTD